MGLLLHDSLFEETTNNNVAPLFSTYGCFFIFKSSVILCPFMDNVTTVYIYVLPRLLPPSTQAAQIASAMILIQHTELMNSKVASFRQHYAKITSDKLEDSLTKFGAIIAQGIIDAGENNVHG